MYRKKEFIQLFLQKYRSYIFNFVLAGLLLVSFYGCDRDDDGDELIVGVPSPEFGSAKPANGSTIRPNTDITIYFNNGKPDGLTVSEGTFTSTQTSITVTGPYDPGTLMLKVTWEGGAKSLTYEVKGALFSHVDKPSDAFMNAYTDIILVFKGNPENVSVSHGTPVTSGNKVKVEGPFFVTGKFSLVVNWEDGSVTLPFLVDDDPIAKIERVWIDHNVWEDGQKGMRIHTNFKVWYMKSEIGVVTHYFYFDNGRALIDSNDLFENGFGKVWAAEIFKPDFDRSVYKDFRIFMPYSELEIIRAGKYSLYFNTHISGIGEDIEVSSVRSNFTYTRN